MSVNNFSPHRFAKLGTIELSRLSSRWTRIVSADRKIICSCNKEEFELLFICAVDSRPIRSNREWLISLGHEFIWWWSPIKREFVHLIVFIVIITESINLLPKGKWICGLSTIPLSCYSFVFENRTNLVCVNNFVIRFNPICLCSSS